MPLSTPLPLPPDLRPLASLADYSRARRRLAAALVLGVSVALAGCDGAPEPPANENGEDAEHLSPLEVTEEAILAADGRELLALTELGEVALDAESRFDAAERFTGASLSPAGDWLAATTAGVAHGAGWLLSLDGGAPVAVAFQYGGGVTLGPWREDGRYLVFAQEGPAPGRALVLVDREGLGSHVEENARPVRLPDHDDSSAEARDYRDPSWEGDHLRFEVEGDTWRLDPEGDAPVAP